jgi:Protein of unknown function (DUF2934)
MKRTTQEQSDELFNLDTQQQEAIRRRAFEIYQQRGMSGGLDVEDWLQAEAELMDGNLRSRAA